MINNLLVKTRRRRKVQKPDHLCKFFIPAADRFSEGGPEDDIATTLAVVSAD